MYEPMMDVYRLGPDGSPDKSFGDGGVLRSELAEGLSVLPDGRFLTWGRLLGNENGPDVAVRRFKGDGRTDEPSGAAARSGTTSARSTIRSRSPSWLTVPIWSRRSRVADLHGPAVTKVRWTGRSSPSWAKPDS